MPPRRSPAATSRSPESVAALLAALDHPLEPLLTLVRSTILGASPKIIEGVKWKAPSFRLKGVEDYFATPDIRGTGQARQAAVRGIERQWIAQL